MKIGYSVKDNEIYNAEDITYHQAKALDILCPCCFENIIKCVRPLSGGRQVEYLAHRPTKDPDKIEQNKVCEARVLKMTDSEKNNLVSERRGQSLALFMENIQEKISDTFRENNFPLYTKHLKISNLSRQENLEKLHTAFIEKSLELSKKPSFIKIVNKTKELFSTPSEKQKENMKNEVVRFLNLFVRDHKIDKLSPNLINSGINWAEKIFAHLKTEQGSENYNFLFACATLRSYLMMKEISEEKTLEKKTIQEFLENSDNSETYVLLYLATWIEKVILENKPHKGMEFIEKLSQVMKRKYQNSRRDNMQEIERNIFENLMLSTYVNVSMMPFLVLMKKIRNTDDFDMTEEPLEIELKEENAVFLKI